MNSLSGWYPYHYDPDKHDFCSWVDFGDIPFTDPFFDETIMKARSRHFMDKTYRSCSSLDRVQEWAGDGESVEPTAFIFHVSRCGSTLLSQFLGLNKQHLSLSEVPFFDDILRLPFKNKPGVTADQDQLLKAAIRLYGRKRKGDENRLFIKLDSWHLFFGKQLREIYPDVPFIILYRNPAEVMRSNEKQWGIQAVPGMIEPEIAGLSRDEVSRLLPIPYFTMILERYFAMIHEMAQTDPNLLLLDYQDGPAALYEETLKFCNIVPGADELNEVRERAQFHGKYPGQAFSKERPVDQIPEHLQKVFDLYHETGKLRFNPTSFRK